MNHYGYDYTVNENLFIVKKSYLKILSKLVSELKSSPYCEKIITWDEIDNDIKLKDFGELATYIQFFVIFCIFSKSFNKKYNVNLHHIKIIRHMLFQYDDSVTLNSKRPYGNSDVWGYISKITGNNDKCESKKIHLECLDILDKALKELQIESLEFEKVKSGRWHPTKKGLIEMKQYIREKKLKRLKNEI